MKEGWAHIGAIVFDATLQRRNWYERTVRPRVEAIIAEHPEAETTSGFLALAENTELTEVMGYNSERRAKVALQVAEAFRDHGIETVEDLRRALTEDEARADLRAQLYKIRDVGHKTVAYIDVLAGLERGVAIDSRVQSVLKSAGVERTTYAHAESVIREAAAQLGWPVGGLDAVLWRIGENA